MSPAAILGPMVLAALAACDHAVTGPSADSVTEIRQERDCTGCESGVTVTLRRDGTARLAYSGKSRFGTSSRTLSGTVARADFERLSALLVARRFFDLKDEYRDPAMADGAWVSTTAAAADRTKTVLDRDGAGPAALREIEEAIEAVRASIAWSPEAS
jgi:hypothetical protein